MTNRAGCTGIATTGSPRADPGPPTLTTGRRARALYTGEEILRSLAARFETRLLTYGPYFFPDLDGVPAADEQAAIGAGHIQANGVRYVGRLCDRGTPPPTSRCLVHLLPGG